MLIKLPIGPVRKHHLIVLFGALIFICSTQVNAEQLSIDDIFEMSLEDLLKVKIVTASRREQSIQDVPMSITSVKPEEFVNNGMTTIGDIIDYIPGFNFLGSGQRGSGFIAARGVSQQGATPVIGVYVDDIPFTGNGPFSDGAVFFYDGLLSDIERIEFLRGPQGTLYGATSIGGAIKYITKKPELSSIRTKAAINLSDTTSGNINRIYSGTISAPLINNTLGFTLSGFREDNGGFVDLVDSTSAAFISRDVNDSTTKGTSADLFLNINDDSSLRYKYLNQKTNFNAYGRVNLDGTLNPLYDPHQTDILNGHIEQEHTNNSLTFEYLFEWAVFTSLSSKVEFVRPTNDNLESLTAIVDILEGNPTGTTTALPFLRNSGSNKFVQELRLVSKNNKHIEWIAGLYYAKEETFNMQDAMGQPTGFNLLTISLPSEYTETALFGDMTYYLTEDFDATLGIRVSDNETQMDLTQTGALAGAPFVPKDAKDKIATYLFNLRYRPNDALSLYTRAASGYRPASSNISSVNPDISADKLWSYEIGAKGNIDGGLITYDVALWYVDWDEFQTTATINNVGVLANATHGITAKGFEGGIALRPFKDFSIKSAISYSRSVLDENEPTIFGSKGQSVPHVPKWTVASRARYEFLLDDKFQSFVSTGFRYLGGSRSAFDNGDPANGTINLNTSGFTLWDLNAGLFVDDYNFTFFVTNLFDKEAYVNPTSNVSAVAIKPRTVGFNLVYKFE